MKKFILLGLVVIGLLGQSCQKNANFKPSSMEGSWKVTETESGIVKATHEWGCTDTLLQWCTNGACSTYTYKINGDSLKFFGDYFIRTYNKKDTMSFRRSNGRIFGLKRT